MPDGQQWAMSIHRIAIPGADLREMETLAVEGEEAHHALRVRRLQRGQVVEVLNGCGSVALARITSVEKLARRGGWQMALTVDHVRTVPPIEPRIEVCSEPPKGHELEHMIDQLSQIGVARWSPLACERSEVEPRAGKMERLRRIAQEASKQCGRAWFMEIGERVPFEEALRGEGHERVIVCHMSGRAWGGCGSAERIRLLIGPVGDLSENELALAREAGAEIRVFGPLTMRIETACCAASAVVMAGALATHGATRE